MDFMTSQLDIKNPKLSAKAMVFSNYIEVNDGSPSLKARPLGWEEKGLLGGLKVQFTLRYILFKDEKLVSKLRYDDIHDKFVIEKDGTEIVIRPDSFSYGGRDYQIKQVLRKLEIFDITDDNRVSVGKAKTGLLSYSIEFESYPDELDYIIREMAVLYVIRMIVFFMLAPI